MMQVILNYPQVHTDMVFENIPTLPIEHRAGIETTTKNKNMMTQVLANSG